MFPGVSCDIKLDVRLTGEGAEANVYGAYVCGGDEKVKIADRNKNMQVLKFIVYFFSVVTKVTVFPAGTVAFHVAMSLPVIF